jgi:hypothetical protein
LSRYRTGIINLNAKVDFIVAEQELRGSWVTDSVIDSEASQGFGVRPDAALRRSVSRRLIACMPAKKFPISLSAVSLETGPPVLGTPDLTELRTLIRRFPKDAGERDCYQYLLEEMQATPNRPRGKKAIREDLPTAISCNG